MKKKKPKKRYKKSRAFRGVKPRSDWERGLMAQPDDHQWPVGDSSCIY